MNFHMVGVKGFFKTVTLAILGGIILSELFPWILLGLAFLVLIAKEEEVAK